MSAIDQARMWEGSCFHGFKLGKMENSMNVKADRINYMIFSQIINTPVNQHPRLMLPPLSGRFHYNPLSYLDNCKTGIQTFLNKVHLIKYATKTEI